MKASPILAFDTAGPYCTAFLRPDRRAPVRRFEEMQKGQAERLVPMLDELLNDGKLGWSDIAAIAVGVGPGNFTGCRIAVATARALALSLNIPAVGVSAFERLHQGHSYPGQVLISLPAPRDLAYVQPFDKGVASSPPATTKIGTHDQRIDQPGIRFSGFQAKALAAPYDAEFDTRPWDQDNLSKIAERIAHIAHDKLIKTKGDWKERPAPLYVRPADAAPPADEPPRVIA